MDMRFEVEMSEAIIKDGLSSIQIKQKNKSSPCYHCLINSHYKLVHILCTESDIKKHTSNREGIGCAHIQFHFRNCSQRHVYHTHQHTRIAQLKNINHTSVHRYRYPVPVCSMQLYSPDVDIHSFPVSGRILQ